MNILLQNRIKELENQIEVLKTKNEKEKCELVRQVNAKNKKKHSKKHLVKVHDEHLEDLKGFNYGGYSFSEIESQKEKELVFIR